MAHPSPELLSLVRATFVRQGTSLNKWCSENGVSRQYVTAVLLGKRNGEKAQKLRNKMLHICSAANDR